jgi:hypothetical protein
MKKPANSFKEWLTWTLRKASYRWPPRQQALRSAQVTVEAHIRNPGETVTGRVRNFYRCRICKLVFSRKGVSIDHIEPVVDPERGWQGWDEYLKRMFCPKEGFQIICQKDHDKKTLKETRVRVIAKRVRAVRAKG